METLSYVGCFLLQIRVNMLVFQLNLSKQTNKEYKEKS